jgi:A/G-specific adenine glycosylase
VGQYIANAVSTFCHVDTKPLLDVNIARVVERFFGSRKLSDIRHDRYLQEFTAHLVRGSGGSSLNWAILDFAAAVCTASRPRCSQCPVSGRCRYLRTAGLNPGEAEGFTET